jgi:hypothetical protein
VKERRASPVRFQAIRNLAGGTKRRRSVYSSMKLKKTAPLRLIISSMPVSEATNRDNPLEAWSLHSY